MTRALADFGKTTFFWIITVVWRLTTERAFTEFVA